MTVRNNALRCPTCTRFFSMVVFLSVCPPPASLLRPQETLERLGQNIPSLSVAKLIGGVPVSENHRALADGCNVAVGTPGRVKFLMKEGSLRVSSSKTLVLDSADWLMAPVFQVKGGGRGAFFSSYKCLYTFSLWCTH